MARHSEVPEDDDSATTFRMFVVDRAGDDDDETADHGRISPWVIGLLALAVTVFVGGTVWAVTGPSKGNAAPPGTVPTMGLPGTAGSPSPVPSPSSASPVASSPAPSGPTTKGAAPRSNTLTATLSVTNSWDPNHIKMQVVVAAGKAEVRGWQATLTCVPDGSRQLAVVDSWNTEVLATTATSVTFGNKPSNSKVKAGSSVDFGFQVTWGPSSQQHVTIPTCSVTARPA